MSEWRGKMEERRQKRLAEAIDRGDHEGTGLVEVEEDLAFSKISTRHFEAAFNKVRPSVSPDDRARSVMLERCIYTQLTTFLNRYDLVHHFVRDKGLGAIEALRAVREITEGIRKRPQTDSSQST